jgi:8-oxo-dGTP pyrophosphatase MutT (NUDIX family)/endonuclease YncB( thermonuclease family)
MHDKKDIVYYSYIDFDKCKTTKEIRVAKNQMQAGFTQDEVGKNVRIRFIQSLKKYVCIDTDDKKSNDFMVKILNKYNIKGNCYPSISNYFKPDFEENAHKHHYWFETDLPITSHIHVNNTLLDIWGPKCYYTNIKQFFPRNIVIGNNYEDYRIIFEPNVKGYYFDDSCKKYPFLTSEMYDDIMNINLKDELFTKKKVPSCLVHKDCIAFERFKCFEEYGFKRDGYSPMSDYHKKIINDYQSNNKVNTSPLIIDDLSNGVVCCVNVDGSNDPFIAVLRLKTEGRVSSYWGLPKGHLEQNESEISSAVRETLEEIGIDVCKYVHEDVCISEDYTFVTPMYLDKWKMHSDYPCESKRPLCIYFKKVKYFLAVLPEKVELTPQTEKVLECKWVRLSEFKKMTYPNTNKMLTNFINSKKVKSKLECKTQSSSPPLLLKLFEKTNSKYYYQFKFKDCDNTMPVYNDVKFNTNKIADTQLVNSVEVWAKVVSVHDGDTFNAVFQLPDEPIRKYKIRLQQEEEGFFIDAPELDSKDRNEKMKAYASKKFVEKMILNKIVRIKINGSDLYRRVLAQVYYDGSASLSESMIQNNHATKKNFYSANTKKISEISELLKYIKKEESKQCGEQMKNQGLKPRFNILDPFHLFDNKKKTMDKPLGAQQNREERVDKKGFFHLFKKK